MALLTPPPTLKKTAGFFKPFTRQVYYEDIYGTRNPDEEFDKPDICESDSDSEDEEASEQEGLGFFTFQGTYPRPNSQQELPAAQVGDSDEPERQWRIAPRINAKTSIPVPSTKKLAPKKFGMFATYDPLDATVVSDVDSGDEEEDVAAGNRNKTVSTSDRGQNETSSPLPQSLTRGSDLKPRTRGRPKRKSSTVIIARPKTRSLINQEIAGSARERRAALRAGRASHRESKPAARGVQTPKRSIRHPIVSEDFLEDDVDMIEFSSTPRKKTRGEILQHARDARASRRGGAGKAANTPRDKSFREVGDQEFQKLRERKLWVKVNDSNINVDEYVRYD